MDSILKTMKDHFHLIGIGGVGMGPLALLLKAKGYNVSGSDIRNNRMISQLQAQGIEVFMGHEAQNIKRADYVVYSSAIPKDNPERIAAQEQGIPLLARAKVLADLMQDQIGITIAGAHGKTTTTSMISLLLTQANLEPTIAIGGTIQGTSLTAQLGQGRHFVAEVDESDGSFLHFSPAYSVITNIDFEHGDYYGTWENILKTYRQFIDKTQDNGILIICGDDKRLLSLVKESGRNFKTYGFRPANDIVAHDIELNGWQSHFDCFVKGQNLGRVTLTVPGKHNVANALACIGLGLSLGIDFKIIAESLKKYAGARRRFELLGEVDNITVIDDYAHHPTEIKATLKTAKQFKKRRVVSLFQPHRYSRLACLWKEFTESFTDSDYVVVTDIYSAGEKPIPGIDSQDLVAKIRQFTANPVTYVKKEGMIEFLQDLLQPGDLVVTLGAGDITQIAQKLVKQLSLKDLEGFDTLNFRMTILPSQFGRIGVLMGGYSSEREISLKSGKAIVEALESQGCKVIAIDLVSDKEQIIINNLLTAGIDVAFIALHGRLGEDGTIQRILEKLNIPYTGSGPEASQLAIHKVQAQTLFQNHHILVSPFMVLVKNQPFSVAAIQDQIGDRPWVVKPCSQGSSIGISIVRDPKELEKALTLARDYDDEIMVERFIQGRELTIGILDQTALPVIEICPKREFFDFTAKYQQGMTDYMIPAKIPEALAQRLQEIALKAFRLLGCRDISRVDFIVDRENHPFLLEVNTIPGFTATSLLPKAAQEKGIPFNLLCLKLVELAYGKKKTENPQHSTPAC